MKPRSRQTAGYVDAATLRGGKVCVNVSNVPELSAVGAIFTKRHEVGEQAGSIQ
jgi:hypothetical protein